MVINDADDNDDDDYDYDYDYNDEEYVTLRYDTIRYDTIQLIYFPDQSSIEKCEREKVYEERRRSDFVRMNWKN